MQRSLPGLVLVFLGLLALGTLSPLSVTANLLAADEKAPAAPPAAPAAGSAEVHLTEYAIKMPTTLPAGPTTFLVHNDGIKAHLFRIEGPGIELTQSARIEPKMTEKVEVKLQAGEYKVSCPIGSHSLKGMTTKLVVTEKKGG